MNGNLHKLICDNSNNWNKKPKNVTFLNSNTNRAITSQGERKKISNVINDYPNQF